ncbi:MAG: HAD family hydrolase [Lachnospiraceae bacterium]|nr:HAD family hydrolase [Lachnospiraceae bacterium]
MIRALLFDLGGTIHSIKRTEESRLRFSRHLLDILEQHGIPANLSPEEIDAMLQENGEAYKHLGEETLVELPNSEIWSRYYLKDLNIEPERIAPFSEQLSFLYDSERVENTPMPHLRETFRALRRMNIRTGLVSNIISTTLAPHALREYGIDTFMECVVMSSAVGIRKPDPRIFYIALEQMGIAPEEAGYVGDTISRDVLGARNAGMGLVVRIENPSIAHRDAAFRGPDAPQADFVIRELKELPRIIQEVNGLTP